MSIAIHITTQAPLSAVEKLVPQIQALAATLETAKPDGKPDTTWAIYGNDYNVQGSDRPIMNIRITEETLATGKEG